MLESLNLPPEYPDDQIAERVRAAVVASRRKVVALDDDPTGVQTVHETAVLARWSIAEMAAELRASRTVFFVLTNSRSVPEADATRLNREIVANLIAASQETGVGFAVASRSDSTLRGHYPAETDALTEGLGGVDGILIVPAFFEGGRYTVDDVHLVRDGERLIPAAETEFARDSTFGYTRSNLREWVEEKTEGRIAAADVASLSIEDLRGGGPERVAALLSTVESGQPVIVNAASYRDLDVVVLGLLEAEASGKRFLYRTGASFVRARAGLSERPLLSRADLLGENAPGSVAGLVVLGSHVRRSSEQLARCLELPNVSGIELSVPDVLADPDQVIARVSSEVSAYLRNDRTVVVYTSRRVEQAPGAAQLDISQAVSAALVAVVRGIEERPGFIIGKGGITSSDIGTEALNARRAIVLGQIRPGIPVWRLGAETRFPDLPYVVFPGNVGNPETLAEIVAELSGG